MQRKCGPSVSFSRCFGFVMLDWIWISISTHHNMFYISIIDCDTKTRVRTRTSVWSGYMTIRPILLQNLGYKYPIYICVYVCTYVRTYAYTIDTQTHIEIEKHTPTLHKLNRLSYLRDHYERVLYQYSGIVSCQHRHVGVSEVSGYHRLLEHPKHTLI